MYKVSTAITLVLILAMNTALSHGVGEKVSLSCSANLEIKENSLREGTYDATITPKIGFSERLVKQHNVFNSEDGRHGTPRAQKHQDLKCVITK